MRVTWSAYLHKKNQKLLANFCTTGLGERNFCTKWLPKIENEYSMRAVSKIMTCGPRSEGRIYRKEKMLPRACEASGFWGQRGNFRFEVLSTLWNCWQPTVPTKAGLKEPYWSSEVAKLSIKAPTSSFLHESAWHRKQRPLANRFPIMVDYCFLMTLPPQIWPTLITNYLQQRRSHSQNSVFHVLKMWKDHHLLISSRTGKCFLPINSKLPQTGIKMFKYIFLLLNLFSKGVPMASCIWWPQFRRKIKLISSLSKYKSFSEIISRFICQRMVHDMTWIL